MIKKRRSVLFQEGSGYGNAVLNAKYPTLDEFDFYAHAFHEAAQVLAVKLLSSTGYSDLDACPIVFLYRHALELYCKSIVLNGTKFLQFLGKTQQESSRFLKSHRLSIMLPIIKQIFKEMGWEWQLEVDGIRTFEEFEALVRDLEAIDPGSYTFRYPVNTLGEASVPLHFIINIPLFHRLMNELLKVLDGATMGIRELYNYEVEKGAEIASYLQSEDERAFLHQEFELD